MRATDSRILFNPYAPLLFLKEVYGAFDGSDMTRHIEAHSDLHSWRQRMGNVSLQSSLSRSGRTRSCAAISKCARAMASCRVNLRNRYRTLVATA